MKKIFVPITIIVVLFAALSCTNYTPGVKTSTTAENALLPKVVLLKHNYLLNSQAGGQDWNGGFDSKAFVDKVLDAALEGKINVMDYQWLISDYYVPMTKDEVNNVCNILRSDTIMIEDPASGEFVAEVVQEKLDRKDVTIAHFWEEWSFNKEKFSLDKEVVAYGLAREFKVEMSEGVSETLKRMMFMIPFKTDSILILAKDVKNKEVLAQNIKYEFLLDEHESYVKGFDRELFFNLLMNKLQSDSTFLIEDFYDSSAKYTYKEYEKMFLPCDTMMIEDPVTFLLVPTVYCMTIKSEEIGSYIFIEDWYIDWKTFKIVKVVKGVAPVRHYFREDDIEMSDPQKKVLFTIWFNNK